MGKSSPIQFFSARSTSVTPDAPAGRLQNSRIFGKKLGVILLDEPSSALDPIASCKIEELCYSSRRLHLVIVTHNMEQAARISDYTAFLLAGADYVGELVEFGETGKMFSNQRDPRTRTTLPVDSVSLSAE